MESDSRCKQLLLAMKQISEWLNEKSIPSETAPSGLSANIGVDVTDESMRFKDAQNRPARAFVSPFQFSKLLH